MYLVELINSYFDFHPHASKDNEVLLLCPFCIDRGHVEAARYTLGINTLQDIGHCHRCDWRGGGKYLFDALANEVGVSDYYQTDNNPEEHQIEKKKRKDYKLPRIKLPSEYERLWVKEELDYLGIKARKYLTDRGISSAQIRSHKLGFCGAGKYTHRIIMPIFIRNICVGYTARTFGNAEPKYLISDGEKFLYNYPDTKRRGAIVLEGPFDVLNVEKYVSKYDVLGRQGSALTEIQIKALSKYEELIFWSDPDEAGVEGAIEAVKVLKQETNCKMFGVPIQKDNFHDPGECTKHEVYTAIKSIRPWNENFQNKLRVSVLF